MNKKTTKAKNSKAVKTSLNKSHNKTVKHTKKAKDNKNITNVKTTTKASGKSHNSTKKLVKASGLNKIVNILILVTIVLILYLIFLISPLEQYLPVKLNFYNYKSTIIGLLAVLVIILNILGIHKVKQ